MLRRRLFCIVLVISSFNVYSQTDSALYKTSLNAIENDSLRSFIGNFESPTLPFTFSETNENKEFNFELLNHFFGLEIEEEEGFGYDDYFYAYVFFDQDYIGLIYTHYYTPGAFGINNYFMHLLTLKYDGSLVDTEELGCFCNDTNMGSNDYYRTELDIRVETGKISVDNTNIHATLVEDEDEESFEDKSTVRYKFTIDSSGIIGKSQKE